MPDDNELLHLFQNVPGLLGQATGNAATSATDDGLAASPEHGGVTDEQVAAWLAQRQRVGPAPLVSGQQPPSTPQFVSGQGQHSAPPGGMEGGPNDAQSAPLAPGRVETPSPQEAAQQPQTQPPVSQPIPSQQTPPGSTLPPTAPLSPPQPDVIEYNGQQIPRARLESWIAFQQAVDSDPELANTLRMYQTGQLQREQPPTPPSPQPYPGYPPVQQYGQPQQQPQQPFSIPQYSQPPAFQNAPNQIPQLSAEDLQDPTIASLYSMIQMQGQQIAAANQAATAAQEVAISRAQQEQSAIVERVSADYATQHRLTAEQMNNIYGVAARLQIVPVLMQGIDPITNLPCPRDTSYAVKRAFDIAVSQLPEFQQLQQQQVIAQHAADENKQRRLTALSGSSGSAPRSTPAPANARERQAALHGEVAAMLNGTWSDPSAVN